MDYTPLFTIDRRLNYDEAIRRLMYWSDNPETRGASSAIRLLVRLLQDNSDNLFFEVK